MTYWMGLLMSAIAGVARSSSKTGSASEPAVKRLAGTIGQIMALGDMAGRLAILEQVRDYGPAKPDEPAVYDIAPAIPDVKMAEAIRDLRSRLPQLAKTAKEVREVYANHGFAVARSASLEITRKVQDVIGEAMEGGKGRPGAQAVPTALTDWAPGYADTVYRTNLATAHAAGRFKAMQDERVAKLVPAFEYITAQDRDVRDGRDGGENHAVLHGMIAAVDHPVWERWSPPGGYNCRCQLRPVGIIELRQRGLIDEEGNVAEPPDPISLGAVFHPGFGRRPDRQVYA